MGKSSAFYAAGGRTFAGHWAAARRRGSAHTRLFFSLVCAAVTHQLGGLIGLLPFELEGVNGLPSQVSIITNEGGEGRHGRNAACV